MGEKTSIKFRINSKDWEDFCHESWLAGLTASSLLRTFMTICVDVGKPIFVDNWMFEPRDGYDEIHAVYTEKELIDKFKKLFDKEKDETASAQFRYYIKDYIMSKAQERLHGETSEEEWKEILKKGEQNLFDEVNKSAPRRARRVAARLTASEFKDLEAACKYYECSYSEFLVQAFKDLVEYYRTNDLPQGTKTIFPYGDYRRVER